MTRHYGTVAIINIHIQKNYNRIKALRALVGRLSLSGEHWWVDCLLVESTGGSFVSECRLRKWSWTGTYDCFIQPLTSCNLSKQCRPWSVAAFSIQWRLIWVCTVCQCPECPVSSPRFTDNPPSITVRRHSDKNSAAISNRSMDFV